jgi:transposase
MKEKSTGVKRRKYDGSFKQEVLSMVSNGRPVSEVAQSLGIGENLIYRWKSSSQQKLSLVAPPPASRDGDSPTIPAGGSPEDTLLTLHKRIRELEQERDILKKALAIFSRQT